MLALNRFLAISAISLCGAFAQNATGNNQPTMPDRAKDVTIFGCMVQGDQPNHYMIKGDGKTYVLKGDHKELARHVNQMVSVSGSMRPMNASSTNENTGITGEIERFKVSSVGKTNSACPQ